MAKKQKSLKKAFGIRSSIGHSRSQQSDKSSANMESEMSSQRSDDMFRKRQPQDADVVSLGGWSLGSNLYFSDTGSGIKFNSSQEQSEENSLSVDSQGMIENLNKRTTRSSAHHQKQAVISLADVNRLSANSTSDSDLLSSEADKSVVSDKIIGETFACGKNVNEEMDSEENFQDRIVQTAAKNGKKRKRNRPEHESCKKVFVGMGNTSNVMEKCRPLCGPAPQVAALKPPLTAKKRASDLKRIRNTISKTNLQSQKHLRNDVLASVDEYQLTSSSEDAELSVASDATTMPKSLRTCKERTFPAKSDANNFSKDHKSVKSMTDLEVKQEVTVTKAQADEIRLLPSCDKVLEVDDAVVVESSEVETTGSPNLFEYESESSDAMYLDREKFKTIKTDTVSKETLSEGNSISVKPNETKLTQESADAFDGNVCRSPTLNVLTFEPRSSSGQSDDSEQDGKLSLKDSDIENTQNFPRKHYSHSRNLQKADDKKSQSNGVENSSESSNAIPDLPPLFEDIIMANLESSSIFSSREKAKRKQKSCYSFTDSAVVATPSSFVLPTRKFHRQLQTSTPAELSRNAISLAKLEFGRNVKEKESLVDSGNISNFHFDSNGSFLSPVQPKTLGEVKSQKQQTQFCDKYCESRDQAAAKRRGQERVKANSHRQASSAKQNDGNKCHTKQYKLLKTKSELSAVEIADQTNAKKRTSKEHSEETERKRDKGNVTKPKNRKNRARVEESSDKKLTKSSNVEPVFMEGKTTGRGRSDLVHVKSSAKNITQTKPKKLSQEKSKSRKNNNLSAENKLLQELDEIDRNYSLVVGDKSADLCFHD